MRFEKLEYEELEGKARELADDVLKVSSDGLGGPFNLLLRSGEMGTRMMSMLAYFNDETKILEPSCRRLAVLMLARKANAKYAWWTHCRRAFAGNQFDETQIDSLNHRKKPDGLTAKQGAVYDFVSELISGGTKDSTFYALKEHAQEDEIVELIVFCGTYTTVAMLLNEGEVGIPDGEIDTLIYDGESE